VLSRSLKIQAQRGRNAFRRWRSGLPLYAAENVSQEVPNDLFQAHLSIYWFFAGFVQNRRVLDLGCGTGYGAAHLLKSGAPAVLGLDQDPRSIAYARSHYSFSGLQFIVADAQELPSETGMFDVIVSSNVFEHLDDPARALSHVRQRLDQEGQFFLVVPPITDETTLGSNRENPFHKSNLFVWEWSTLLERFFQSVRAFRHLPPPDHTPDFTSPFPSTFSPADFSFVEVPLAELKDLLTLGAVFLCSGTKYQS
jgi:SAM-dependent methyltransferase